MNFKSIFFLILMLKLNLIECGQISIENEVKLKSFLWRSIEKALNRTRLGDDCGRRIARLMANESSTVSVKMVDSSGSVPSGLFDGTLSDFGDYDQCLALNSEGHEVQHCIVKAKPELSSKFDGNFIKINEFPMLIGLCLPQQCKPAQIVNLLRSELNQTYEILSDLSCDAREKTIKELLAFNYVELMCMLFLFAMFLFVALSTFDDVYSRLTGKKAVFIKISALSNGLNLIAKHNTRFDNRKTSIDFSRFVWVLVIITAHASFCGIEPRLIYKLARLDVDFPSFFKSFMNQAFFNTAVIEGFFYIGGYVTYLSIVSTPIDVKSCASMVVNRWLRFVPGLISLMAIEFVWPVFTYGPMVTEIAEGVQRNCLNNWWKNFLFISNWDKIENMCLTHSWYISADFQLFLLALVIIWIMNKIKVLGLVLVYSSIAIGMIVPGVQLFQDPTFPSITLANKDWGVFLNYINNVYFPTTGHLTPYFIGVLIAHYSREKKNVFGKPNSLLSIFFVLMFLTVTFSTSLWNTFGYKATDFYSAVIFVTLYRFVWTISFAFGLKEITRVAAGIAKKYMKTGNKNNNNNNTIKSEEPAGFRVVNLLLGASRLYFSMYLIHSVVLRYFWASSRSLYYFGLLDVVERTIHTVAISFVVAIFFYLLIEAPFENIRKSLFSREQPSTPTESKV